MASEMHKKAVLKEYSRRAFIFLFETLNTDIKAK
jgi:hypothetical protein